MTNLFTPPRFRKYLAACALVSLAAFLLFHIFVNAWLAGNQSRITASLGRSLHAGVAADRIHYNAFRGLTVENLSLKNLDNGFGAVRIERTEIDFSFTFYPSAGLRVKRIRLEEPSFAACGSVHDISKLTECFKSFYVKEIRWGLLKISFSDFDLEAKIMGVPLKGKVKLGFSEGMPTASAYLLSQMEPGRLELNLNIKNLNGQASPSLETIFYNCSMHDTARNIRLDRLDGRLYFSKEKCRVDNISGFFNDLPLLVNGRFDFSKHPQRAALEISTYPGQLPALKSRNPFNAVFRFAAMGRGGRWSGYLKLKKRAYLNKLPKDNLWAVVFREFKLSDVSAGKFPEDVLKNAKFRCRSVLFKAEESFQGNRKRFYFSARDAYSYFLKNSSEIRFELRESKWCGGRLHLKSRLNLNDFSWEIRSSLVDAEVKHLLDYYRETYPIRGRLSLRSTWTGKNTASYFSTSFRITEGIVSANPSIRKLAGQIGLDLPSQVSFEKLSGSVTSEDYENYSLENLQFVSKESRLSADLKVCDGRIAGDVTMELPQSLVRASSQLKWLLRFVEAAPIVDLHLKVAGSPSSPRLEWLDGRFKQRVESRLMPWMKAKLTKEIEKNLE